MSAQSISIPKFSLFKQGVEQAIVILGRGFLAHPENLNLRKNLQTGNLSQQNYYYQLLQFTYRILFVLIAEQRNLLLDPNAPPFVHFCYLKQFALTRLCQAPSLALPSQRFQLLCQTLQLIATGCPELALPALGKSLWVNSTVPDLLSQSQVLHLDDDEFLKALRSLTLIQQSHIPISYKTLPLEYLGKLYESLLERTPEINIDTASFTLKFTQGNDRKTTASYYTPDGLVQQLLESTLEPVLQQILQTETNPIPKILDLKICDPCCGTGHFLLAAAHRMTQYLVQLQGETSSTSHYQVTLTQVIGSCLYGVDLNPMAVELCRMLLWLVANQPGLLIPLERHIRSGNALLGTTPALLQQGIPDRCFTPISGDDPALCHRYRQQNRQEKQRGKLGLPPAPFEPSLSSPAASDLSPVAGALDPVVRDRLVAHAWCAAFVWQKSDRTFPPITEQVFRQIQQFPAQTPDWLLQEIHRLAQNYQFFHWHLEFPEIFSQTDQETPNPMAGWSGGFDVILTNPPWDKVELLEKEWFAQHHPEIARQAGAERKQHIAHLSHLAPELYAAYQAAVNHRDRQRHFIQHSGLYQFCHQGRVNTYASMIELSRLLLRSSGYLGCIVPSGIATDHSTRQFFQDLLKRQQIVSLFDFENRKELFAGIQGNVKFCLLTISIQPHSDFQAAAQLQTPEQLIDPSRKYSLNLEKIYKFNPNTLNCPAFSTQKDAEINQKIYEKFPILIQESSRSNSWNLSLKQGLFNMTADAAHFLKQEQLESAGYFLDGNRFVQDRQVYLPLYEAKLIHQFNHRAATFTGVAIGDRFKTHARTQPTDPSQLVDPGFQVMPRYWVSQSRVQQLVGQAQWFLGFRNAISAVADSRSLVASIVPAVAIGNSLPLILLERGTAAAALLAILNSFILDYLVRQKANGSNLNFYIFKQLPIPPPEQLRQRPIWCEGQTLGDWLLSRVLELVYTARDLQPFAQDCGYWGPPFSWNLTRRFQLRCELDAACFHLYQVSREETDYILETFMIVRRKEEQQYKEYRTKRVILELYDTMAIAQSSG